MPLAAQEGSRGHSPAAEVSACCRLGLLLCLTELQEGSECPELSRALSSANGLQGCCSHPTSLPCSTQKKSLCSTVLYLCVPSSIDKQKSQRRSCWQRVAQGEGGAFVLFVVSVCWFKAIMLGGLLIGKAGVSLMIAVFGK